MHWVLNNSCWLEQPACGTAGRPGGGGSGHRDGDTDLSPEGRGGAPDKRMGKGMPGRGHSMVEGSEGAGVWCSGALSDTPSFKKAHRRYGFLNLHPDLQSAGGNQWSS